MARLALRVKAARPHKHSTQEYTRCSQCGRTRSVYQKFMLCRLCLRKFALEGKIPGMKKASW